MNKTIVSLALISSAFAFAMDTPTSSPRGLQITPTTSPTGPRNLTPTKAREQRDLARKRKLEFKHQNSSNRPKTKHAR